MKRAEVGKIVIECIGVYLQRESCSADVESGGLDADLSPGVRRVRIAPDVKLAEDLGFTPWDMKQLLGMLSERLDRHVSIDESAVCDDEKDITLGELIDVIYDATE